MALPFKKGVPNIGGKVVAEQKSAGFDTMHGVGRVLPWVVQKGHFRHANSNTKIPSIHRPILVCGNSGPRKRYGNV